MAKIYEDTTLNDKIYTALLRAGKNATDSDVSAVSNAMRDANEMIGLVMMLRIVLIYELHNKILEETDSNYDSTH